MATISETTLQFGLCISCGLCAAVCPEQIEAIEMVWDQNLTWTPKLDPTKCTNCGLCARICPNTPEYLCDYALRAATEGERFGLPSDAKYFISYDLDFKKRIQSASGGAITALLIYMLESGEIDGIIVAKPVSAPMGEPHSTLQIVRKKEDLENARSSQYHPLSYEKVLEDVMNSKGQYILLGIPCVVRGFKRFTKRWHKRIRFVVSPVCSHNVTGQFVDELAMQEGVSKSETYFANLRDKTGNISDANNFNNLFTFSSSEIRRNRFETSFTDMWRNYFFAHEGCLYCSDFYGADADLTVKDAWGRLSVDPLGISLLVVRNPELVPILEKMRDKGKLHLEACDADEVANSQPSTSKFKHTDVRDRMVWKSALRDELIRIEYPLGINRRWWVPESWEYWRLRLMIFLSKGLHRRKVLIPVHWLLRLGRPFKMIQKIIRRGKSYIRWFAILIGIQHPKRSKDLSNLKVLISGGFGYGNVGDEAQLAANIEYWKKANPGSEITVLTPNQLFTERIHNVHTELAPRIVFYNSNKKSYYHASSRGFKVRYFLLSPILIINAMLIRGGLPVFGITSQQVRLLEVINNTDVLFLSGGGYLTGLTLSRLWDNMLLIRLASMFGVPVILSGQTIGVFKDPISRLLAKWGLKKVNLIYLRDATDSPKDLAAIGIASSKIESTFDDALFYKPAPSKEVFNFLANYNINNQTPYLAVNAHYWGMDSSTAEVVSIQMANILNVVYKETGLKICFVPMTQGDEKAIKVIMEMMIAPSFMAKHNYEMALTVGTFHNAALCLTMKHHPIIFSMAGCVPTVSLAFDDYYYHKNKGAMKLFGQENYSIYCQPNDLSQVTIEKIGEAWRGKIAISSEILARLDKMRPHAAEVIYRWLAQSNP
jgi:coenzyme F420 hydrogenase subunit beta